MLGFLLRGLIVALGLWLATAWVPGVSIDSPSTLILAGLLLGIVNSIVRPFAIVLTLPMTILTLGLFCWSSTPAWSPWSPGYCLACMSRAFGRPSGPHSW